MYKLSRYNYYIDAMTNQIGLYNSNTNSFTLASKQIFNISHNKLSLIEDRLNQDSLNLMIRNGFIVDYLLEELDIIKYKYDNIYYNSISKNSNIGKFSLTVHTSMECNFRCAYCFQSICESQNYLQYPKVMAEEVYTCLMRYINHITSTHKIFDLTLFGGEPILYKDHTMRLIRDVKTICDKNGCKLEDIGFFTNGYNFDTDMIDLIKKLDINSTSVITLDGPPNIHNERRFLKSGGPTFDKIYNNLINILKYGGYRFNVNIRINIDSKNKDYVGQLLNMLKSDGFLDDDRFSFSYFFICLNETTNFKSLDGSIIDCVQPMIALDIADNFKDIYDFDSNFNLLFKTYSNHSQACDPFHFHIDPLGNMYKCHHDIGYMNRICGNIINNYETMTKNHLDYLRFRAWHIEKCSECKALPKCVFFCPNVLKKGNLCNYFDYAIKRQIHSHLTKLAKHVKNDFAFDKPFSENHFFE